MISTKSYEHWKKGGKEINKFQAIVRGCKEGVRYLIYLILDWKIYGLGDLNNEFLCSTILRFRIENGFINSS